MTGLFLDSRTVAAARQQGEVVWVGCDHFNGRFCLGSPFVFILCSVRQLEVNVMVRDYIFVLTRSRLM